MVRRRRSETRLAPYWFALVVTAVAAALAIGHLHRSFQRELEQQSHQALAAEQAKACERIRLATDERRHAAIKALASLHVEGLAHTLQAWDASEAEITGTFQWERDGGFLPGAVFPPALAHPERLPELWQAFRAWRAQHPLANACDLVTVGRYRVACERTIGTAEFAENELKYQAENLDILAYAKQPVDPWAGWAGDRDDPGQPWIVWYQPGPDAPVRGCFVDVAPLVASLRAGLADRSITRLAIEDDGAPRPPSSAAAAPVRASLERWLPGHVLVAGYGDVFAEKQSSARLSVLTVVLLGGALFAGVAVLTVLSRREARDAARKTTFVAQVSHELRTPLTSIRMFADLLATPALSDEKRAKYAGSIGRESARLGGLVERLLAFNALEHGRPSVTTEAVDVGALVDETLAEMAATFSSAGIAATRSFPPEPIIVSTDRSIVKQALINLLDNAIKYAASGRRVRVQLGRAGGLVRVQVADAGPGIPRSLRARIFEPFVQGGALLTEKSPGVGLGLSLARGTLRQAGGDLVLLPAVNGACFEIQLPSATP